MARGGASGWCLLLSGKVWGTTTLMLQTPSIEIHRLDILPQAHCSMHKHEHKCNAFVVISGALTIEVEKEYGLTDSTVLRAGDCTTVRAGYWHRFVTGLTPTVALEIYYQEPLAEDIIRRDCGGLLNVGILDSGAGV